MSGWYFIILVVFKGNYVRYWSFDTLDNLIQMEGTVESNYENALVTGQVDMYSF